jgi:hypothetical protein
MYVSFRKAAFRLAPVVALVAASIAGIAVGTASAGTAAAAAAAKPAATAPPPPVDHQLCYNASSPPYTIPTSVRLINQFSPNGFVPVIRPTVTVHCNPVQKTVLTTGQVFPITNPDAHLACYTITPASPQPTPTVVVANQFGSATLVPSQPNLLCVPSWKSLTGPPGKSPSTPPNLNHFTCYPVTVKSGAYTPPPVGLVDEFGSTPRATVSPIPSELCLPTEKIVPGAVFPIINASLHLLCFPVSPTPFKNAWDENQFGTQLVTIMPTKWLCLPSTKTVVG